MFGDIKKMLCTKSNICRTYLTLIDKISRFPCAMLRAIPGKLNKSDRKESIMENKFPKNVRQIGNVSDSPKIYVEDYVDTFFLQLSEKSEKEKQPEGAFLIGEMQKQDNEEYIYIYGAIKIKELKKEGGEYLINDKIWKCGCEECSQYFEEGEIIGWFVTEHDLQLAPGSINVKLHKKLFPKKNTVLVMKDSSNQEDVFFVHKLGDLMEIGGHYTYYEKNPCMQNYMIASRKKNGTVQTESVEDTAAQSFRSLVRERGGQKRERRTGSLMYGISTCLVLILIVMGVSMMNNFSKMKSLQNKINVVAEGEKQTSSPDVKETSGAATTMDKNQEAADTEKESKEITEENEGEEQTEDKNTESVPVSGTAVAADENDDIYVVEKGDTLAIISKKMYGDVSHVDAISRMNGLQNGNLIYIGQKLILP